MYLTDMTHLHGQPQVWHIAQLPPGKQALPQRWPEHVAQLPVMAQLWTLVLVRWPHIYPRPLLTTSTLNYCIFRLVKLMTNEPLYCRTDPVSD